MQKGGVLMDNIMLLEEKLRKCEMTNIEEVKLEDIDDISEVIVDTTKSSKERILDFLFCTKNPYVFKVGNNIVKMCFSNNNLSADQCITDVFKNIYK